MAPEHGCITVMCKQFIPCNFLCSVLNSGKGQSGESNVKEVPVHLLQLLRSAVEGHQSDLGKGLRTKGCRTHHLGVMRPHQSWQQGLSGSGRHSHKEQSETANASEELCGLQGESQVGTMPDNGLFVEEPD